MATLLPIVAIIDDDPATLTALGRVIRASGFEAATYRSAEAFLNSPPSRRPLCIVLDLQLEGMSGIDLHRRLDALGSVIPIIAVTAFDDPRLRAQARELGCVAFFTKSSNIEELLTVIRSFVQPPR